ncbi:MAG TPA: M23 family metallopeptidase [Candidatus Sulfotelmatobacter sp.]|nr:M23 family metallopeptidase [Candidatus Sulfotelmatobacter sp.]
MAKRFYTVLVLPDATSSTQKFHINRSALTVVSSLLAVAILAFAFFLYQYVQMNVRLLELKRLRQEASERNVFAAKVSQLEAELAKMRELDRSLREVAGLDKGAVPAAQGGADGTSGVAMLDAVQQRTGRLADWVNQDLATLGRDLVSQEQSFKELKVYLEEKRSALASTPTIAPVQGLVTAGFGYRRSPFTGNREVHEGIDIAAPYGTPVVATADGVVSFAGPLASYGHVVFINHGHGFATFYAHNSRYAVKEGQAVRRGQIISYVGNSGRTTGPHVHYEVHVNGAIVNPLKYIVDTTGLKFSGDEMADNQS